MTDKHARADSWHEIILATLKANNVKLIVYVPDRVFTPLIESLHADQFFTTFAATREEEAIGIITGAWMGGWRGAAIALPSGPGTVSGLIGRGELRLVGTVVDDPRPRGSSQQVVLENLSAARPDGLGRAIRGRLLATLPR